MRRQNERPGLDETGALIKSLQFGCYSANMPAASNGIGCRSPITS